MPHLSAHPGHAICVCIHVYTGILMCTHAYAQAHTLTFSTHTRAHTHSTYTHIHTCTHTPAHACKHAHTHACTHIVHTCTHTHTHTPTHTQYTHAYTHAHTDTDAHILSLLLRSDFAARTQGDVLKSTLHFPGRVTLSAVKTLQLDITYPFLSPVNPCKGKYVRMCVHVHVRPSVCASVCRHLHPRVQDGYSDAVTQGHTPPLSSHGSCKTIRR